MASRLVAAAYRRWDYAAAQRVDHFIAISTEVQARIQRIYHRDSVIIYPPVEAAGRFTPAPSHDDYFLVLSRLVPYKRIDLAVEACTRLGLPLLVGGTGRDRERLGSLARPAVQFLGYVPDEDLPDLFARCRAFIFPGLEDFGIVPVQAMAAGRPVIAHRGGGSLDTVIPGKTGAFFEQQTVRSLIAALQAATSGTTIPRDPRACLALRRVQLHRADHRVRRARLGRTPFRQVRPLTAWRALGNHPSQRRDPRAIISSSDPEKNEKAHNAMNIVQTVGERIVENVAQVIIGKRNEIRLTVLGLLCQGIF